MSVSSLYASQLLGGTASSSSSPGIGIPEIAGDALDTSSSGTPSFSSLSQLFSQLQQLATSNPSEFQSVTAQLSSQLSQLASQSSGSDAQFYSALANNFENASRTGDASDLSVPSSSSGSGTYAITGKMIENSVVASALLGDSGSSSISSLLSMLNPSTAGAASQASGNAQSTLQGLLSQDLAEASSSSSGAQSTSSAS